MRRRAGVGAPARRPAERHGDAAGAGRVRHRRSCSAFAATSGGRSRTWIGCSTCDGRGGAADGRRLAALLNVDGVLAVSRVGLDGAEGRQPRRPCERRRRPWPPTSRRSGCSPRRSGCGGGRSAGCSSEDARVRCRCPGCRAVTQEGRGLPRRSALGKAGEGGIDSAAMPTKTSAHGHGVSSRPRSGAPGHPLGGQESGQPAPARGLRRRADLRHDRLARAARDLPRHLQWPPALLRGARGATRTTTRCI